MSAGGAQESVLKFVETMTQATRDARPVFASFVTSVYKNKYGNADVECRNDDGDVETLPAWLFEMKNTLSATLRPKVDLDTILELKISLTIIQKRFQSLFVPALLSLDGDALNRGALKLSSAQHLFADNLRELVRNVRELLNWDSNTPNPATLQTKATNALTSLSQLVSIISYGPEHLYGFNVLRPCSHLVKP